MRLKFTKAVQKFFNSLFDTYKPNVENKLEDPMKINTNSEPEPLNYNQGDIKKPLSKKQDIRVIVVARPKSFKTPRRRYKDKNVRERVMTNAPRVSVFEARENSPLYEPLPDESFGQMVKRYRLMKNWRRENLLKRLNILNLPKSLICSIEEWGLIPDPQIVERLAYVLGASRKVFMNASYKHLIDGLGKE